VIRSHYHRTLTAFLELVFQIRPREHPVNVSSAYMSPSKGIKKIGGIFTHTFALMTVSSVSANTKFVIRT
jgi:hypothetical protein